MIPVKIGVFGAGHLGKIHIKCIRQSDVLSLVGFYDPDERVAAEVAAEYNTQAFESPEALIAASEAVDIVTPTIFHYDLAARAIQFNKPVFIEKPLTHTVEEGQKLQILAQANDVKIQVGHVERFNPAFLALKDTPMSPMFVEAHRLANFNPRSTDVSVVLDLMIHDIDLVLHLVRSEVKDIHASGVAVVSASPDIANARIAFENGCVANLTASRLSLKQMRKVRLFQSDAYLSLDFLEKKAQIIRLYDDNSRPTEGGYFMPLETPSGTRWINIEMPEPAPVNAIQMELESFAESIRLGTPIKVPLEDGLRALAVAHRIVEAIGDTTLS
jgi:predicted dehydrogenase